MAGSLTHQTFSSEGMDHLGEAVAEEFNVNQSEMCRNACENVALQLQARVDNLGVHVDLAMETGI